MNAGSKIKKDFILETVKWFGIVLLLMIIIIASYVYHDYSSYIKDVVFFIITCIILCILVTTKLGKFILMFGRESYVELQKVVWPTYQDSLNTTVVVVAVTIFLSVVLWGLDTMLVHLISFGLRL